MSASYKEKDFEDQIEKFLLKKEKGGYGRGNPVGFEKEMALDPLILLTFVEKTQFKEYKDLERKLGNKTEGTFLGDLCAALNSEYGGCLDVLRKGFKCYGKTFYVAYFAPVSGLNPGTWEKYEANQLFVTRQLRYAKEGNKSLDLVISLNGIPVATIELKNAFTGQGWKDAVVQYQTQRDPRDLIFSFKKRTLVHFVVDTEQVHMTTQLKGKDTVFLPFNRGSQEGAGNPDNPEGYKTAYLWEEVLQKDSFMEILARFMHLQEKKEEKGKPKKETMIFPRYHQLEVVRGLVKDAREKGAGQNYLVQHSAGSGKSNSIAWLTHRLQSLYNDLDEKVFDSIVVVTDRRVLDQQLQNTIYKIDHKKGVVKGIKGQGKSTQLAEALEHAEPIIITTLQTFPFVTEKISQLPNRKYAVIIDEAHSSQGGESAAELKGVLSKGQIREEARARAEEEHWKDSEEMIFKTMAQRGKQPNISFFAFTATPKYKTLEVFGTQGEDGKPHPFHLYSMKQAIEESFILDVLKHYTTYTSYCNMVKAIQDDPLLVEKEAVSALMRFLRLHPTNIAQKTEIIIEHFQRFTRKKIGGKAKAMVVTASRLQAVRYKLSIDKYLRDKGYQNIKSLVAFSGVVRDPDDHQEYTEVSMNHGIRETELPGLFSTDEYNILIVAEKYQTGFDQPLLHTMYVDKRLAGIHAIQTLSRLNRIHPGKEDTLVLDFENTAEDIRNAFQPYYKKTEVGEQVEPSRLYRLQSKLEKTQVFYTEEVEEFARTFYKPVSRRESRDHKKMNRILDPAVNRFKDLDEDEQKRFRKDLKAYRNLYAFLSQIIPFQDSDLEKLYCFVRFLRMKLPSISDEHGYHFDEEVALKYYRLEKVKEDEEIRLENQEQGEQVKLDGPTSLGTGIVREKNKEKLSKIIDDLNQRFATNFNEADQLFFESIKQEALNNPHLQQAARENSLKNFGYVFDETIDNYFTNRIEKNSQITTKFFDEPEFKKAVTELILQQVYDQLHQE
jgi:type I restriction enzyme R subunit